jgi:hypothetical protein
LDKTTLDSWADIHCEEKSMQGRYTIALCDILGFSDLVKKTELRMLVDTSLAWLRRSLHHSMHKNSFPSEVPPIAAINAHQKLGIAWFSDTLLIYTRMDDNDAVRELFEMVGWLLFETMIEGTRIRAGIAHGEAFIDPENSLYVGEPIIEAHRMEQCQNWSGAALCPSAFQRTPADAQTGNFDDWWVVPYPVPTKSGVCETLAINWTTGLHQPGTFLPWSPWSPEPTVADWEAKRPVCEKWKNTKAFHDQVCRCCNR